MNTRNTQPLRLSLITGTAGRTEEIRRLATSLAAQTAGDFEWIVVDQNSDDRIDKTLAGPTGISALRHVRCQPNLSAALNLGAELAQAPILGFPDDDSWLDSDVVGSLLSLFDHHPDWHGVVCKVVDAEGRQSITDWPLNAGRCNRLNAWPRVASTALFMRRDTFLDLGGFDPSLGLGGKIPLAGHDLDLVLRAINQSFNIQYVTKPVVRHPQMLGHGSQKNHRKAFYYAVGAGRLMRDHRMPLWWNIASLIIPASKAVIGLLQLRPAKSCTYFCESAGRLYGLLGGGGGRPTVFINAARIAGQLNGRLFIG